MSVKTDAEGAEAAAASLNEFVSGGAVIEETLIADTGEPFDPARTFTVRAFFSSADRAGLERAQTTLWHLAQLRSMFGPRTRELAEEDWAEAWKKHYTVQHIGKRLVIKPSWVAYAPRADEVVVELDPGMAFGTGLHPSTRLCMIALEQYLPDHPRVLDVGTGSGILAITAAQLGARDVLALDTDPTAVETAARNAALNRVAHVVCVESGSLDGERLDALRLPSLQSPPGLHAAQLSPRTPESRARDKPRRALASRNLFDLICINILAEVICELAPALASVLCSGGVVIASGILDFKTDAVIDALRGAGIRVIERKQEEDWVTLVAKKEMYPDGC